MSYAFLGLVILSFIHVIYTKEEDNEPQRGISMITTIVGTIVFLWGVSQGLDISWYSFWFSCLAIGRLIGAMYSSKK